MKTFGLTRISLLSSSFSGSTLFGIMLCQDPRFIGFGDTYLIPGISSIKDYCCCGSRLDECKTRLDISARLTQSGSSADVLIEPKHRIPYEAVSSRVEGTRLLKAYRVLGQLLGYRNAFRKFLRDEEALLKALADFEQYEYVVDGSKSAVRADIFNKVDPNTRMVHLVRHPFSVLLSALTRHETRGRSAALIKDDWIVGNQRAKEMCEQYGNRAVFVQYEKLVTEPSKTMATVAACVGAGTINLDPDKLDLSNCHLMGNRSRHQATSVRNETSVPSADDLLEVGLTVAHVDELVEAAESFGIDTGTLNS